MYELQYRPRFHKDLKRIPLQYRIRIEKKIALLALNPYMGKKLDGELAEIRSVRVWPYKIMYTLRKKAVLILSVGHRQGVYK